MDPCCEFCCQSLETIGHVLWECPFAWNIWALVREKIQKCLNTTLDFFLFFCMLQDKLKQRHLEIWAVTAWALWNACNKFYFDKIQLQPRAIADGALAFLTEYRWLMKAQRRSWCVFHFCCGNVILFFFPLLT